MSGTTIFHLLGYPGVGKLTVARALAERSGQLGQRLVVVDNHLTSLPVLAVLDADGSRDLPAGVWRLVGEIRERVHTAIEELSPIDRSFVFTNVVVESDPDAAETIDRVRALAAARSARYAPVLLRCERAEHLRRVRSPERSDKRKWTDPHAVAAFVEHEALVRPPGLLELDITDLGAEQAATFILDRRNDSD